MTRKVLNDEDEEEFHLDYYQKMLIIINCFFIVLAFICLGVASLFGDIGYLLLFLCLSLYAAVAVAFVDLLNKRNHNNED